MTDHLLDASRQIVRRAPSRSSLAAASPANMPASKLQTTIEDLELVNPVIRSLDRFYPPVVQAPDCLVESLGLRWHETNRDE